MSIRAIWNSFKEGLKGMIRHPLVMIASVSTILLMLIILSAFAVFSADSRYIMDNIKKRPPIEAFMKIGATNEDVHPIIEYLEKNKGDKIEKYEVLPPEDYYNEFLNTLAEDANILEGFDYNSYIPYIIRMQLVDPGMMSEVERDLNQFEGIDRIRRESKVMEMLSQITKYVNLGTMGAFVVLMAIALFVISNMVRISVYARSEEISIMKYIGAPIAYIRLPYILEGAITGIISAVCAWGVVYVLYDKFFQSYQTGEMNGIFSILPVSSLSSMIFVVCTVTGVLIGAVGSAISVRKYVQV